MKKLPRPTASRTMRAWLPGRLTCSTAWRSGNHGVCASGAMALISRMPGDMQHDRGRRESDRHDRPNPQRAGLPDGEPDQARAHDQGDENLQRIGPPRRRLGPQQQRRFHVPDVEQRDHREEHGDQQANAEPLQHRGHRETVVDDHAGRCRRGERRRNGADRQSGEHDAKHAAGEPERDHLGHVDRRAVARTGRPRT